MISTPLLLCAIWAAVSVGGQSTAGGYNYPRPTTSGPFTGYNYPKPAKPFNEGYTYTTPQCPLVLPSTSTVTDYQTVVSTAFLTETQTLPPITSTRTDTSYVTLPPVVQTQTETEAISFTITVTEYQTSTTTEIRPTTVTSLLTTTYCQPNTYLPPVTPPSNAYLPAVEPPAKEYLPQRPPAPENRFSQSSTGFSPAGNGFVQAGSGFDGTGTPGGSGFVQAGISTNQGGPNQGTFISTFVQQPQPQPQPPQSGPIKRATGFDSNPTRFGLSQGRPTSGERPESNEVIPAGDQLSQPAINIIYVDRNAGESAAQPPAGFMNWLLCKFNLSSGSCSANPDN